MVTPQYINGHVAFACEASMKRGSGHVMRCLSLASFLYNHGFEITFVTSVESLETVFALKNSSYAIQTDETDLSVDWLIIDNYDLGTDYERNAYAWAKKILMIDDLIEKEHLCDVLLNQTYGVQHDDYEGLTQAKLLLGSHYSILREDFRQESEQPFYRDFNRTETIFICFGGVNPHKATEWTLQALELYHDKKMNLIVCAGGTPENIKSIEDTIRTCKAHNIEFHVNANNVPALMRRSDLAIGAGGTMSWERCCMALPTLAIEVADNQREVLRALGAAGALLNLGMFEHLNQGMFIKTFADFIGDKNVLGKMSGVARTICDGRGVMRILPHMLFSEVSKNGSSISIRAAFPDDCDFLFALQTQKNARRFSRNSDSIQYDEHCAWFDKTLHSPDRALYIVESNGKSCGMTRLDRLLESDHKNNKPYEVSILISEDYQGQGIGCATLLTVRKLKPYATLWAHILAKNAKSVAMFKNAGYVMREDNWYVHEIKSYKDNENTR